MTLNGRNAPLAENKNSGAHQKNFNEFRPTLWAAKCRPVMIKQKLTVTITKMISITRITLVYRTCVMQDTQYQLFGKVALHTTGCSTLARQPPKVIHVTSSEPKIPFRTKHQAVMVW